MTLPQALHRFEQLANELLADSTLAGQEGTLQYLSACAALQQWAQAALALLVLGRAGRALNEPELQQQAEELLEEHFQVCAVFIVAEGPGHWGGQRLPGILGPAGCRPQYRHLACFGVWVGARLPWQVYFGYLGRCAGKPEWARAMTAVRGRAVLSVAGRWQVAHHSMQQRSRACAAVCLRVPRSSRPMARG